MDDIVPVLRRLVQELPVLSGEALAVGTAADEIVRLREKCNSRTRWLQICMRERYEQLTDGAKQFADALFAEELEPDPPAD
jgi:hypothetical protein